MHAQLNLGPTLWLGGAAVPQVLCPQVLCPHKAHVCGKESQV